MNRFDKAFPGLRMKRETEREIEAKMPQFLFYEPVGKSRYREKLCKCSACGRGGVFEMDEIHLANGKCPMCGEPVTLIAHNKLRNGRSLERWIPVVWFQARGEYLYAVGAKVTRRFERNSYDGPDWRDYLDVTPYEVYRFRPGEAIEWKDGGCYVMGQGWFGGWYELGRPREPIQPGGYYSGYAAVPERYYLWQTEELEKSPLKYCAVERYICNGEFAEGKEAFGVIKYLTAWCERPKLELVVKWGLWDVATDLVERRKTNGHEVNWKADTPWDFLKISKQDWRGYWNCAFASVELLKANRRFFRLTVRELMDFTRDVGNPDRWLDNAIKLCRRGVPLKGQVKYISKQEQLSNRSWSDWLRFWLDYLEMAETLDRDVSMTGAIMPRDLQQAHDDMVDLRQEIQEAKEAKALQEKEQTYQKRRKTLEKKYAYQSGELMIRVPASAQEIIREGNVLKICVGGYAARHMTGQTTILFLRRRRKPDTPYICIELDKEDRIRQIHGYKNEWVGTSYGNRARDPREKFRPFLNEWLAWVQAGSHRETKNRKEVSA